MFLSVEFWLFVLLILLIHNVCSGWVQNLVLLLASYGIYAYFDARFVPVLIVATIVNYAIGLGLARNLRFRWAFLVGAILFDVGLLAFFKYAGFFATLLSSDDLLNIVLPLGMSFYSFRLLSYLFDVYNKRISPSHSWIDFALYIAFFPQIVAGPIERAARFLPALKTTRRLTTDQFGTALIYILIGLFYKFALANTLIAMTDRSFQGVYLIQPFEAVATMILYSICIYTDFAAYSSMAIGVSMLFGVPAMENFRQPWMSQSVTEFWTRWHISLSSWFRDYVFFPLARSGTRILGKRLSFPVEIVALMVTMLLTGIWHGSSITFVIWGGMLGVFMVMERIASKLWPDTTETGVWQRRFKVLLGILVTQLLIAAGWIVFRSSSLENTKYFFLRLLTPMYFSDLTWLNRPIIPVLLIVAFDTLQMRFKIATNFWNFALIWRVALLAVMLITIFILGNMTNELFIYSVF